MNRCSFAIPEAERDPIYWKLLCYEIMYLWNLLGSCSRTTIDTIIEDCEIVNETDEPILGLSQFLMGSSYATIHDYDKAIISYKKCIQTCNENPSKVHLLYIPAYASYELAVVLMKCNNDDMKEEAHELFKSAQIYKNYDFEHRLKLKLFSTKVC